MKKLYKTALLLCAVLSLGSCEDTEDIPKVQEGLELSASSTEVALDGQNLTNDIITFNWTEARQLPDDDYIVSYETKLDVVGNNFGSSTVILNYEDSGVFSRSFTSEQIQNWANERWNLPPNTPFTLEFRVVTQWEGGAEFQAPEVRTITVNVQPIPVFTFDADNVFIDGSAVPGDSPVELSKTLENENQYAYIANLVPGELNIPVAFGGATNYICPQDLEGTLQDGVAEDVVMQGSPISWNIETAGQYRIVINMQDTTVAIYSETTDLQPAIVQWTLDGVQQTTTVNDLWRYGAPTGWAWVGGGWTQSMADPQIFVYSGAVISGRTKFGVHPHNQSYVYTGNSNASDTTLTLNNVTNVVGGYSSNERNAYFVLPGGTNFIILDIRNMTIVASQH